MTTETVGTSLIDMHNQITAIKIVMVNEVMEDPEVFPSGPAAGSLVIASANMGQLLQALKNAIQALGVNFIVDDLGPIGDIG